MKNLKKLSIIIPVYNEEKTIIEILSLLVKIKLDFNLTKQIVIVNDFSNDNSESLIKDFIIANPIEDILYYKQDKNYGKELL